MNLGELTDLAMWTAIVSFFMPLVISVVQQPSWTQRTRALVGAVTSGIAGLGTVYFTTPQLFDTRLTPTVVLTVIMASIAAYRGFWKQTGTSPAIEKATTVK
jgi:hypothetical protein